MNSAKPVDENPPTDLEYFDGRRNVGEEALTQFRIMRCSKNILYN